MHFQNFVKRSTKGIFIVIIAIMAFGLIFSGTYAFWGVDEKDKGDAGVIFGNVKVSKATFRDHARRSLGHERYAQLKMYSEQFKFGLKMDFLIGWIMKQVANRSEAEKNKKTWENIILLQDAQDKGLAVSDEEVNKEKDAFLKMFEPSKDKDAPPQEERDPEAAAIEFLEIRKGDLETFFREALLMDKVLDLVTAAEFADYGKIYGDILKDEQYARVYVAGFDPKEFVRDLSPVGEGAIRKYYDDNIKRFEIPVRIQLLYLLADIESFKSKVPDPDDKEIEAYYNKNKSQFEKVKPPKIDEHGHDESEHHPERKKDQGPKEYRTLQEAREDVIKKIKEERAWERAKEVMREVGERVKAAPTPSPDTLFDDIKKEFDGKGVPLTYDVTALFDQKTIDEVEKQVGKNSRVDWGFGKDRKLGDVSPRFKTEKGFIYYRLQSKKDPFTPGLIGSIRERIVKILQKKQALDRAKQAATDLSVEINLKGLAAARTKYRCAKHPGQTSSSPGRCGQCSAELERLSVEFKYSDLFKLDGRQSAFKDDQALGREANKNAMMEGKPLPIGQARVFDGSQMVGSPKQEWSFVVVMDDIVEKVPENIETEFGQRRGTANEQARRERRKFYVSELVARAELKDFMKDAGSSE